MSQPLPQAPSRRRARSKDTPAVIAATEARAGTRTRRAIEAPLLDWFKARGWKALPFQREVWTHYLEGRSGLLHTPTGSGKTLAAFGGPLLEAVRARKALATPLKKNRVRPLQVLWITPLKALAADTTRALSEAIAGVGLDWQVGQRTGDASARDKRLARAGKLDVLVTTPESLALLLSYPDTAPQLRDIRAVIVDEWHELLANKRGVLLQLCLARLRKLTPGLRTWGLSATLGNLDEAAGALMPVEPGVPGPGTGDPGPGGEAKATAGSMASTGAATDFPGPRSPVPGPGFALVSGVRPRTLTLETLRPKAGERFPWSGHLGLAQLSRVLDKLLAVKTSLVFTNTRAQAELWHQALAAVWPEDPATLALHHGSLSPRLRNEAEQGLREGTLRCVVATSSLDLGVDFPAVDQVLQIGSPKGIARLLQRAGRARHRPGEAGHVVCVPTHALELVEYAAARRAIARAEIEPRHAPRLSLDVLASTASPWPWAAASRPRRCWRKCAAPRPSPRWMTPPGARCWTSSSTAAARWSAIRISTRWCATPMASIACTSVGWPCATGCPSAPSPAMAACRSSFCAVAGWARSRNCSWAACAAATASSSPGAF